MLLTPYAYRGELRQAVEEVAQGPETRLRLSVRHLPADQAAEIAPEAITMVQHGHARTWEAVKDSLQLVRNLDV